jgi:hypothetical protein
MKMCFSLPIAHLILFLFFSFRHFFLLPNDFMALCVRAYSFASLGASPMDCDWGRWRPVRCWLLATCVAHHRRRKIDKNCNEFANFCAENLHDLGGVGVAREFFALPNAALPQARTLRRSDTLPCCRECSQACSRVMTRADGLCKIFWCLSHDRRVDTTRALTNVSQCMLM